MMTTVRITALATAVLALGVAPAGAAEKLKVRSKNPANGKRLEGLYIRSNVKSYNMGLLKPGDLFSRLGQRGAYAYGYAYGEYNGCGWVSARYLVDTKRAFPQRPPCPGMPPSRSQPNVFEPTRADQLLDADPNAVTSPQNPNGNPRKIAPECGQLTFYANFRGGRYLTKTPEDPLPPQANVRFRYKTRTTDANGKAAAMVLYKTWESNSGPRRAYWGYVPFDCLRVA